jgi:hypothetical protein
VVHGGGDIASVAAVPLSRWKSAYGSSGAVVVEPISDNEKLYYLWVIGKPSDDILARGFVQILQSELAIPDTDIVASAKRVQARLGSSVGVNDLRKGMFASSPGTQP